MSSVFALIGLLSLGGALIAVFLTLRRLGAEEHALWLAGLAALAFSAALAGALLA